MSNHPSTTIKSRLLRRGLAGILSLALLLSLIPSSILTAGAAGWEDQYIQTLVDWGVMRGDIGGNMAPQRSITRAEFVTMMNRAYGYKKMGGHPFTDVSPTSWYNEDIDIGYNIGYFKGTSPTTASPNDTLTREQAAVLLARNMMLQPTVGETLGFSDSRTLSDWSRGLVGAAAENGIISGYDDGTFQPFRNITRGEVAAMLVRAIGTPVQEAGDHALGNVYGNVTVNTAGVKLRDGVIAGNLYLTGGIDLGDVLLENVTVLGQIIVSGGGESNSSESSVVLRNVVADGMIVDSIGEQFVTIRAEGNTDIPTTTVRTNAYVDDSSLPGYGLSYIELDGAEGALYQLAGNIKDVINKTPGSDMQIVQGSAGKVTVDEEARDSSVLVDGDARVDELNLDTAANVTGTGDIKNLNVGAAGSTVEQLPDKIVIRPGITADIAGSSMNSTQGAQSSAEPKLLAGYPAVRKIAPQSAELVFRVNKPGTIYWAVSAVADGSVSEADLLEPPVYGNKVLASGRVTATAANTDYTAAVNRLTSGGSYYVTAMLVDGRGEHSPIKVTSFTTPDDSVPAFADGYPVMTLVSTEIAQVTVMTTKSCLLYYALLPRGAKAPTEAEFKAAAIPGNLGYGSQSVTKNVTTPINVNSVPLDEKADYVLYLWLVDHDGAQKSRVTALNFTTPDETPPIVTVTQAAPYAAASASAIYTMDEPGTVVWAVVTKSVHDENGFIDFEHDKDNMAAKIKVQSGRSAGALASGTARSSPFTISPLNSPDTNNYVLYYLGQDTQGNLSQEIKMVEIYTTDTTCPTVEQHFTDVKNGNDDTKDPYASSGIRLEFSEDVQGGTGDTRIFKNLYDAVKAAKSSEDLEAARMALNNALRQHIKLYQVPTGSSGGGRPEEVTYRERDDHTGDWTVDFRNAQVFPEEGKLVIYLPNVSPEPDSNGNYSALNLEGGSRYYFRLQDIRDLSFNHNKLNDENFTDLPMFTTVYAQVTLSPGDQLVTQTVTKPGYTGTGKPTQGTETSVRMDTTFYVKPESTSKVSASEHWDLIFWTDTPVSVLFYRRDMKDAGTNEDTGWELLNTNGPVEINVPSGQFGAVSLAKDIMPTADGRTVFPFINSGTATYLEEGHTYQYGLRFTKVGNRGLPETSATQENTSWGQLVNMKASIIAGNLTNLSLVANNVSGQYDNAVKDESVKEIGQYFPTNGQMSEILTWPRQFSDRSVPSFTGSYPQITAGSSAIHIDVRLNRSGTIYYVVAPAEGQGSIDTSPSNATTTYIRKANDGSSFEYIPNYNKAMTAEQIRSAIEANKNSGLTASLYANKTYLPTGGEDKTNRATSIADSYNLPTVQDIISPTYDQQWVASGSRPYNNSNVSIDIPRLVPSQNRYGADNADRSVYYVYFVLQGTGNAYSPVYVYRATMSELEVPSVSVSATGTTGRMTPDDDNTELYCTLVESTNLPTYFRTDTITITDTTDPRYGLNANHTMTLLEAMITTLQGSTGRTYFDKYATLNQKNEVSAYITSDSGDTAGDLHHPAGRWKIPSDWNHPALVAKDEQISHNFSGDMEDTGTYILLAAVRHTYGGYTGADYGFGAASGLIKPDDKVPSFSGGNLPFTIAKVTNWDGTGDLPSTTWQAGNPADYKFNGSVTISFDDNAVYHYDPATSALRAVVVNDTVKTDQVSIKDVLGGSAVSKLKIDQSTKTTSATRSFTLYFEGLSDGDTLIFFSNGRISNGSRYDTTKTLTLTFEPTLKQNDYSGGMTTAYRPGFRTTWG